MSASTLSCYGAFQMLPESCKKPSYAPSESPRSLDDQCLWFPHSIGTPMVPQKSYKRSPNLGAQIIAYRVAHTSLCFIPLGMGVIMVVGPEQITWEVQRVYIRERTACWLKVSASYEMTIVVTNMKTSRGLNTAHHDSTPEHPQMSRQHLIQVQGPPQEGSIHSSH